MRGGCINMWTEEIIKYLEDAKIPLRLATVSEKGWPVVLSMWYVFEESKFYLATPNSAKIVRYLRKEPRCAFEVASDQPPYCGIRGQAEAKIVNERGIEILETLLKRYLGSVDTPLAKKLLSRNVIEVAIELKPINIFKWDFTDRMKDSMDQQRKIYPCPDNNLIS